MKTLLIFFSFLFILLGFNASSSFDIPAVETPNSQEEIMMEAAPLNETNEQGRIPILEYHSIGETEARWTRSVENFRKDLLWLYNNDYVLLSIDDYAKGYYPIPAGKKPVILTFDDGKNNQFNMLEDGTVDPNSAVGLLDEFYKQHPDFGSATVFYVNANPFGQSEWIQKKLQHLHDTGRQVGYHTLSHTQLTGMDAGTASEILRSQQDALTPLLPEGMKISQSIAYPHGSTPDVESGALDEFVKVGLLVGAEPAYPLYHSKADAYRTPRIQAIDDEWLRHFGRNPGQTEKADQPENFKGFVSDGDIEKTTPSGE